MNGVKRPARWRAASGILALAATLALAGCGSASTAKAPTTAAPTATIYATPFIAPTATPVPPGQWTQVAALAQSEVTMAPSNPTIAYQIGPSGVLRSTDSGATWTDLGTPRIPGLIALTKPELLTSYVSPVNPDILFMILSGTASSCGQGASASESGPGTGLSCEEEFMSSDRGVSWNRLQLPVKGIITTVLMGVASASLEGDMQRQENHLYALVINETTGQQHGPPPGRLVVSADGGLTWRQADGGLVAAGQGLWDYAATASGATVFALTEPLATKPATMSPLPPLTLWRSDNAGASWIRLGAPPGFVTGMRACLIGGVPTLYLQDFDTAGKGYIQASPWGASGRWQTAPASGPAGPLGRNYSVLAIAPDGSLLIADGAILAWRAGVSHWRQVAADPGLVYPVERVYLLSASGGHTRLWLGGSTESDNVVEYTTLTS